MALNLDNKLRPEKKTGKPHIFILSNKRFWNTNFMGLATANNRYILAL